MSLKKQRGPDPADDPLTAVKEKLARAKAAEIEALAELAALRLSSTVDRDNSHDQSASGVGSGSAPRYIVEDDHMDIVEQDHMDIVEQEDHTALGARVAFVWCRQAS